MADTSQAQPAGDTVIIRSGLEVGSAFLRFVEQIVAVFDDDALALEGSGSCTLQGANGSTETLGSGADGRCPLSPCERKLEDQIAIVIHCTVPVSER
jgi:hypothetical protein